MMKTLIACLLGLSIVQASVLGDSAASMAPGTWKRMDPGIPNDLYNRYGSIFVYSNDAIWDASTGKLMFWGRDHGDPWQGVIYETNTDTWKAAPLAFDPMHGGHTYDNLTMDFSQHVVYHFTSAKELFKFNPVSESWSSETQGGTLPTTGHGMALEYFPEMGGLVHCYGSFGNISFFDLSTKTWRNLASGLAMGPYHNLAEYNPVHHCVIAGGGNGSSDLYRVDGTGTVTKLKNAPFGIGIHQGNLTCDRVSGMFLYQRNDSLYGYDVQYDYWFNLGPVPGIDNVYTVVAPVPEYGVVAFLYRNLWLYKYAGPYDTLSVTSVELRAQQTTIEQYLWTYLDVITTYQGGARDTSNTKCGFVCLDTNILTLSSTGGKVTGKALGEGRIAVMKRGAVDTITITVTASTAQLDSIRLSVDSLKLFPGEQYPITATGYFHKNSQAFNRPVQDEVSWNSSGASTAKVALGVVTGISTGGPVVVTATQGTVSDGAFVTVFPALSFIKRINFQVTDTPWSHGWLADNRDAYAASPGYGWVSTSGLDTRDDRTGSTNFLLKSFVSAAGRTDYRVDCPDGSYIIKYGLGDNQYGSNDTLWYDGTQLAVHSGASNLIQIDTVAVTGGGGLVLTVNGKINYLVVISNEGVDIDNVADDGGTAIPVAQVQARGAMPAPFVVTAYPNPFNPAVKIAVSGQRIADSNIGVAIYNTNGRMVYRLSATSYQLSAGITWNASGLPSGVYLLRVTAGKRTLVKRLVLAK